MANIKIDFNNITGKIKPMHGVGQPPFGGVDFSMFKYLKDAGIPHSRLHDVGGVYALNRFVDIPNIFRDFSASAYDPMSYDFVFTDLLIKALMENGVEPVFRLGVTIENSGPKVYRIFPPADFKKWAVVCEHIIRHYTKGWNNGFKYDIKYWEIWNEPDNSSNIERNPMWRGTRQEYFELYEITSKHLKKCFPEIKIGGYGSCGFYALTGSDGSFGMTNATTEHYIGYFNDFLNHVKKTGAPLDFFSWHTYDTEIKNNIVYADYARRRLDEEGFTETETSCNEWNCRVKLRGTYEHAALTCGVMLAFQDTPLDSAQFYDARYGTSIYGSIFNPLTAKPFPTYYAFTAFNRLYTDGNEASLTKDCEDIYAVASVNSEKTEGCIVLANPTAEKLPLTLDMNGKITKCILTADGENDKECDFTGTLPAHSIVSLYTEL